MGNEAITVGSQSKAVFYREKLNSTETDYDTYNALTDDIVAGEGEEVVVPTEDNAAYIAKYIGSSKPNLQDDDTTKFSFDQADSGEGFYSFRDKVVVVTGSSSSIEDYYLENGVNIGGSAPASLTEPILLIWYGPYNKLKNPDKMMVWIAAGTISPTSGSFDTKNAAINKPTLEFVGVKLTTDLTIKKEMFDESKVSVTEDIKLSAGQGHYIVYLDLPTEEEETGG